MVSHYWPGVGTMIDAMWGNPSRGDIMRWLWLLATLLSWVLCFTRHGPGALAFWLLLGMVGAIGTVLAFAQARIEANARPDPTSEFIREWHSNKPSQD
jgi:hypothetical protein